jgi:hypothetical protein
MSVSGRNVVPPHFGHFVAGGTSSAGGRRYQASAPSRSNTSATCAQSASLAIGSPHASQYIATTGTPQSRWREMHQSGRVAIMFAIRSFPQPGIQRTRSISASARRRRSPRSIPMNHCSVARKTTGFLHRQQCG